jgi:hypothetical protein
MKNGNVEGSIEMTKWETLNELYIEQGLKIFPVMPNGKTPLIKEWQKDCSNNYMQVLYWLENAPDCNWGLPATPNNLFIIDLDVHDPEKNGVKNFDKIIDKLFMDADGFAGDLYDEWCDMGPLEQVTPSGGHHLIFQTDDELRQVPNCSNAFKDYPGIDIRTDGYIVVEPSTIGDNKYIFDTIPSAPNKMHPKLKKFILENVGTKQDNKKTPYEKPKEVLTGDRDNQLFQYINQLYFKTFLDYDEVLTLALKFNEEVLEEPFDERDVKYKVKKAFEKNRGKRIIVNVGEE